MRSTVLAILSILLATSLFAATDSYPYDYMPYHTLPMEADKNVVLDHDLDGDLDLILGSKRNSPAFGILLENNNGIFAMNSSMWGFGSTNGGANAVAAGDLNGDMFPDIVFNKPDHNLFVYLNSFGSFNPNNPHWSYSNNSQVMDILLADFDNDGILDLALANYSNNNVILKGNGVGGVGDGTFSLALGGTMPGTNFTYTIKAADCNRDGNLDLICANGSDNGTKNSVVFLNGSFSPITTWTEANSNNITITAEVADINDDGLFDIIFAGTIAPAKLTNIVEFYTNSGGNSFELFAAMTNDYSGQNDNNGVPIDMDVADVDRDNDFDMILRTGRFFNDNNWYDAMAQFYKCSNGTLLKTDLMFEADTQPLFFDTDNDGDLELVCGYAFENKSPLINDVPRYMIKNDREVENAFLFEEDKILLQTSDKIIIGRAELKYTNFQVYYTNVNHSNIRSIAIGDINDVLTFEDKVDYVIGTSDGWIYAYTNRGGDKFDLVWSNKALNHTNYYANAMALGDVNGDGSPDLVYSVRENNGGGGGFGNTNYGVYIRFNYKASNGFTYQTTHLPPMDMLNVQYYMEAQEFLIDDIDEDGDNDILGCSGGPDWIAYNKGSGVFDEITSCYPEVADTKAQVLGDFDGDGDLDIARGNDGDFTYIYKNNSGVISPVPSWNSPTLNLGNDLQFIDIDKDGDLDLGVANGVGVESYIMKNKGGVMGSGTGDFLWKNEQFQDDSGIIFVDMDWDNDLDVFIAGGKNEYDYTVCSNRVYEAYYADNFITTSNLPNTPTRIDQDWIGEGPPADLSDIRFNIIAYDNEGDGTSQNILIRFQVSILDGTDWRDATVSDAGGDFAPGPIPSSFLMKSAPDGFTNKTISWNSTADNIQGSRFVMRMVVYPGYQKAGKIQNAAYVFYMKANFYINGAPNAFISSPEQGSEISGTVKIFGGAFDYDFQNYIITIKDSNGTTNVAYTNTNPVPPIGVLYNWDTSSLTNGDYTIELKVYDNLYLVPVSDSITVKITEADSQAPSITNVYPPAGSEEIAVNSPVIIKFSEQMNENTLRDDTMTLYDGIIDLSGQLKYKSLVKCLIFEPSAGLSPNRTHIATVDADFQDIYGIPLGNDYIWNFKIAKSFPILITSNYPTGEDVRTNTSIVVKYAYDMSGFTNLNDDNFYVQDIEGNKVSGTVLPYNPTNKTVTFIPTVGLDGGTLYIVIIKKEIIPEAVPEPFSWYFITADTKTPYIVSTSPASGSNVLINGSVSVLFNKTMNGNSFTTNSFYIVDMANTNQKLTGDIDYLLNEYKAVFTPDIPFIQDKSYRARLTTQIKDSGGQPFTNTYEWTFFAPASVSNPSPVFPANDSISNILKNIVITAEFNKDMNQNTLNASTFYIKSPSSPSNSGISGILVLSNNRKVKFTPDGYLSQNTWYTSIFKTGFKATDDTSLTNIYKWKFKTIGAIKTNSITLNPSNNSTNISLSPVITAIFTTNLEIGSIHAGSFYAFYITGTNTNTIPADVFTSGGKTAQISLNSPLPQDKDIFVRIDPSVKTVLGNSLNSEFTWSFRTLEPLSENIVAYPTNGTTNVSLLTVTEASFATNINPATLNDQSFYIIDGTNKVSGTRTYNDSLKKITFTPALLLNAYTTYTAYCTTNIKTTLGTALSNNHKWTFKTIPSISTNSLNLVPVKNATNISLSPMISVTFSTDIKTGTAHAGSFYAFYITGTNTNTIPADIFVSGGKTVQLSVKASLPQNEDIFMKITPAIQTVLGNSLDSEFAWSFRTIKPLSGNIISYPTNGTTNVSILTIVEASFATNINSTTINDQSFYLLDGTNKIAGTRTYDDSSKKITFTPAVSLRPYTVYTAYCTTNIKTILGTALSNNTKWSFKTIPPLESPTNVTPTNFSTNVNLINISISATFVTNIDPGTLNSGTFKVKYNGNILPGDYISSEKNIKFSPSERLSHNTTYTAILSTGLRSTVGTGMSNDYKWSFATRSKMPSSSIISNYPAANSSNFIVSDSPYAVIDNSYQIEGNTVNLLSVKMSNIDQNEIVFGAVSFDNALNKITINPVEDLKQGNNYTIILSTNIRSTNGASFASNFSWNFNTTKPLSGLESYSPTNNTTNVSLLTTVEASFATNINPSTINDQSFYLISRSNSVAGTRIYNDSLKRITFTPAIALSPNTVYTAYCTTNLKTILGTSLISNQKWNFKTVQPLEGPTNVSPTNSSINIELVNVSINATFVTNIEPGSLSSGTFYLKSTAGVVPGDYISSGKTISFLPSIRLSHNTVYTSVIGAGLRSVTGTSMSNDYKWTFTTLPNISHSAVISNNPSHGNTNAGPKDFVATISISNQHSLDGSTVNVLSVFMSNTTSPSRVLGNVSFDLAQNKITYSAGETLTEGDWYRINVTTNVKTIYGNTFYSNYYIDFKVAPPYPYDIKTFSPANMQSNVALTTPISVTFYTDIDSASVDVMSFYIVDSDKNILGGSRSITSCTLEFTPAGGFLKQNTSYTVYIPDYGIDYVVPGKSVVKGTNWWFKTKAAMTTPVRTYPADKQAGVDIISVKITAYFGYALDSASCIKDNFKIFKNGINQISANVSYDSASSNIQLIPQKLESECNYTVILSKDVRTEDGVSMLSNYEWTFKTGKAFDKEGGITSAEGLTLVIPQNALTSAKVITIDIITNSSEITNSSSSALNIETIDLGYRIGPGYFKFNKPVTITIDYSIGNLAGKDENSLAIFYLDTSSNWQRIGGTVDIDSKTISATIEDSGLIAVYADKNSHPDGSIEDILIECQPRVFITSKFDKVAISFFLPEETSYSIKIFNMAGKIVDELADKKAGFYGENVIFWDGNAFKRGDVADGLYIIVIKFYKDNESVVKTKTLMVIEK